MKWIEKEKKYSTLNYCKCVIIQENEELSSLKELDNAKDFTLVEDITINANRDSVSNSKIQCKKCAVSVCMGVNNYYLHILDGM